MAYKHKTNEVLNTCVPSYILKLCNDEIETNPQKKLKQLTMDKMFEKLNMNIIYESWIVNTI